MTQFNSAAEFHEFKKYIPLIRKAMLTVKLGEQKKFAYFKEYSYAEHKQPCVLVDFTPQCLTELKTKGIKPTAEGTVGLTMADELLFAPETGTLPADTVQKFFNKIGGIKSVVVKQPATGGSPGPTTATGTPPSTPPTTTTTTTTTPMKVAATTVPPLPQPPGTGATSTAPTVTRPVARAPLAKPDLVRPKQPHAIPLPVNAGEQQQLVDQYIDALTKAQLPVDPANKKALLDEARKLWKENKYPGAMMVLNALTRDVAYPGVDEWALEGPSRKYEAELLTEKFVALLNLLQLKRKKPTDWKTEEAAIIGLLGKPPGISQGIREGLIAADPARVKKVFDEWAPLVAKRDELATKLRKAWIDDQKSRFKAQTKGNKNHPNVKVAGAYGTDAMLELAQMAEVQAIQYKKIPANAADPVAQGDWHTKLDVCELAAIYGYSTADYTPVAQVLRDSPKGTDAEKAALEANKKKFGDYIKAAESGLAKLPAYTGGAVVRCTKSLWQNTIDAITRTGEHVEKSFMSAGKKQVAGFGDIVWEIDQVTTGKDISLFSLNQTEGEVLFPPGSKFRFVSAEVTGDDGEVAKVSDHTQFGAHVSPTTKVAKIWWVQA